MSLHNLLFIRVCFRSQVVSAFTSASRRLIVCDYGGTLVPRESAELFGRASAGIRGAPVAPALLSALHRLTADAETRVFVVRSTDYEALVALCVFGLLWNYLGFVATTAPAKRVNVPPFL
jgi:hypothetical protein